MPALGGADGAALEAFLARLVRLDPAALVRLRPSADGTQVWAMLPFRVLVCVPLPVARPEDMTFKATDIMRSGWAARRRDGEWRWPLPSSRGRAVETLPVADLVRLAEAAARTLRTATTEGVGGRAVGQRALRDALLDHVAIVVTTGEGERIEIPQRLVQGLVRLGLHTEGSGRQRGTDQSALAVTGDTIGDGQVTVRIAMGWIGLETRYGSAWYRPISPLHLS